MITIKNKSSITKMEEAGFILSSIFDDIAQLIIPGVTTLDLDSFIAGQIVKRGLTSRMKGYMGYKHVSCISINQQVVHGVPSATTRVAAGDLVKVDVCASFKGYCADMARQFYVGDIDAVPKVKAFVQAADRSLNAGIAKALPGNRLGDISAAIQQEVERAGYGVVRDFAGHGIGKLMHEDPEILNYGKPGQGPVLRPGMAFALEPMITMGDYAVRVADDGWTVVTKDNSLACHVEDTIVITDHGPKVITRTGQNRYGV
jgi:methionyl aminopeptidase